MLGILAKIEEFIKEILIGGIILNFEGLFEDVNLSLGEIFLEVSKTPETWNSDIFSIIKNISDNVILPISGLIITFVLCYELITMITEKNNMHDIDTFQFFKYFFKAWVTIWLVTHAWDITMAVFDVGRYIVAKTTSLIYRNTHIDIEEQLVDLFISLDTMSLSELFKTNLTSTLVFFTMKIMSIVITVVIYARMVQIYLYCSVSPIPFATITNREWGQIGTNYFRSLFALAFQAFFIMICVGIYSTLVNTLDYSSGLWKSTFMLVAYTALLCTTIFKTHSLSKSIFNAH